jgi:hypothetical protein
MPPPETAPPVISYFRLLDFYTIEERYCNLKEGPRGRIGLKEAIDL